MSKLALLVLNLPLHLYAENGGDQDHPLILEEEKIVQDPLIVRALLNLEKRMGIQFNIPFPKNFDCDAYRKRSIALIVINGSKVYATRPVVNPYDQPRTVEWAVGPADSEQFAKESFDCFFDFYELGEFSRLNILTDWASDGTGNHQIDRGEGETDAIFFEHARLTYQLRTQKADNPATAAIYLSAYEKMAKAVQALRKEEQQAPGAAPK